MNIIRTMNLMKTMHMNLIRMLKWRKEIGRNHKEFKMK